MSQPQPIAVLLGKLRAARGSTLLTEDLRRDIDGYGDDPVGRRRLERDLNVLRSRGLVETCLTDGDALNRDGVSLVEFVKPARFVLTVDEHAVLTRVRRQFRRGERTVSALPDGPDGPQSRWLDELTRLLRVVEEHGADQGSAQADPIRVSELARLLGVDRDRVVELIREADDLRDSGLFPGLIAVYGDDTDTDELGEELAADNDDIEAVAIIRADSAGKRGPTRGVGLDELGRFAYTRQECEDRLALLDQARDAWGPDDDDFGTAGDAKRKLEGWMNHLTGTERHEKQMAARKASVGLDEDEIGPDDPYWYDEETGRRYGLAGYERRKAEERAAPADG